MTLSYLCLVKKDAMLDSLDAKERSYNKSTNGINFRIFARSSVLYHYALPDKSFSFSLGFNDLYHAALFCFCAELSELNHSALFCFCAVSSDRYQITLLDKRFCFPAEPSDLYQSADKTFGF